MESRETMQGVVQEFLSHLDHKEPTYQAFCIFMEAQELEKQRAIIGLMQAYNLRTTNYVWLIFALTSEAIAELRYTAGHIADPIEPALQRIAKIATEIGNRSAEVVKAAIGSQTAAVAGERRLGGLIDRLGNLETEIPTAVVTELERLRKADARRVADSVQDLRAGDRHVIGIAAGACVVFVLIAFFLGFQGGSARGYYNNRVEAGEVRRRQINSMLDDARRRHKQQVQTFLLRRLQQAQP